MGNLTALGRTMYDGAGVEEHTEAYAYKYDNWGRLQSTTHTLDGGTPTTLASNTYDAVGRLSGTTRGAIGATPGPASLSSGYTYNVRGWLTGISGSLFSETLTYETPRAGSSFPGQWGGNISGTQWNTPGSSSPRYDFDYDLLGRLTKADFGGANGFLQRDYSRNYFYDLNGNMESLETPGPIAGGSMGNHKSIWVWTQPDGNQPAGWEGELYQGRFVQGVTGHLVYSPVPGSKEEEQYAYDAVGNRTEVLNAQGDTLNMMRYNLLNLPEEYVSAQGDTVNYVYSVDGEKLYVEEKPAGGAVQGTEYAANYRIDNGAVTMIHTDAGYYTPVTSQGGPGVSYSHVWYLKDHLGNNRVLAYGSGNAVALHDHESNGAFLKPHLRDWQ